MYCYKELRLREGRVAVAYFPEQLHEILGVGGEDHVFVVNQGQGVHLLEVLNGEHMEPGAGTARLVELVDARQVHGQAEAGGVVLGAEPVMDIGLGQLVYAVYSGAPPLQVAFQHGVWFKTSVKVSGPQSGSPSRQAAKPYPDI